jgi:cytochrome c biogenesis protein CcdA
MNLNLSIGPLVSLIAGILILVVPRLLNYIVAIYLIIIGLLGLFGGSFHLRWRRWGVRYHAASLLGSKLLTFAFERPHAVKQ